ncbi:Heat shock protein. Metallo peptidase. MEROPS family M48B [Nakamurella panacisegetis]|uniref:Protease HtpX homolog n=1 Tax=Nakamurella panacisegetis TaxID=1090615 RepID=A0A1H0SWN0_9ACTN|nr:M48 family metallopeptidase [Nakamurella panacisegetis]SDP46045.1 Heat shock protein. Metallo peptidase. MEROPS family M48B [Nakamurella panacisegetis]
MYHEIARNKRRSIAYVILFVLIWIGVGALVGWLVGAGSTRPGHTSAMPDVVFGIVVAAVFAAAAAAFSLVSGARLVLATAGARPADPARYAALCDLVEALAIGDGLPTPAVYVIDDPAPNACATGISPQHAAVCVTTGLLAVMDREELEGVLAHEMSHIKNFDTRLLLIVATMIGLAGLLSATLWRTAVLVRGQGRNAAQVTAITLLASALLAVVGFLVGPLIRLAVSRRREAMADASGVELTRNPAGLLRALRDLDRTQAPLKRVNHATASMFICDPLRHHEGFVHRLFDTHPPLAERIAALESMLRTRTV